jgi:hypothetical protein
VTFAIFEVNFTRGFFKGEKEYRTGWISGSGKFQNISEDDDKDLAIADFENVCNDWIKGNPQSTTTERHERTQTAN